MANRVLSQFSRTFNLFFTNYICIPSSSILLVIKIIVAFPFRGNLTEFFIFLTHFEFRSTFVRVFNIDRKKEIQEINQINSHRWVNCEAEIATSREAQTGSFMIRLMAIILNYIDKKKEKKKWNKSMEREVE